MNVFLFGIGGTGARVLRSLTYCLAANMGNLPAGINFIPMIIDHDKTNEDKRIAIEALENYRAIQRAAHPEGFNPKQDYRSFFLSGLKYLSEVRLGNDIANFPASFEFEFGTGGNGGTFADFINLNAMNGALSTTGDLLQSIYSNAPAYVDVNGIREDNPIAELNLDLGKGYRGNPNIGSVVFDSISDNEAYKYFTNNFIPDKDVIVIIGSIFGGTGSSGIPKLIEAIRSNPTAGWNNAKVACIMVMPYFKVDTPDAKDGITPAIQDNIFKSKQKAALSFYKNCMLSCGKRMNEAFKSIYYIAEEDDLQHRNRYSEGGSDQKNYANIVELLSAMGIVDFVKRVYEGENLNKYNEYGLEKQSSAQHALWLKHFCDYDKGNSLKELTRLTLCLKHFRDHIKVGGPNKAATYYGDNGLKIAENINSGIYKDLAAFTDKFSEWLNQLGNVNHSFAPYDFRKEVELNKVVNGYVSTPGGVFNNNGVSYKDFDSMASKAWANGVNNEPNKRCAFIKVIYEASKGQTDNALRKPKKD